MEMLGTNWYGSQIYASRMGHYTTVVEQSFIRSTLSKQEDQLKILDVGGGDGRHSCCVKELGHHPIVLERDSAPINILLNKQVDIPIIQADAMTLPVRAGIFDIVLTIEVSICTTGVNNYNTAYFKEVNRILKNNGLFIFTAFNKYSCLELLRKFRRSKPSYEILYYSESARDYRRKLINADFEIIKCRGFRWLPFKRGSNNRLVPIAAFIESLLMLKLITCFSPWLYFAARKRQQL